MDARLNPGSARIAGLVVMWVMAACTGGPASDGDAASDGAPVTTGPTITTAAPPPHVGPKAADMPEPRTEVVGALWQGRIAVAGGLTLDGGASRRFDLWDPATDSWTAGPDLPAPLHHAGMAVLGDRLYVVGGYSNGPGQDWDAVDEVSSLGPGEVRWRAETVLGEDRGALAVAAVDGRLVALGGVIDGAVTARVESWAPGESRWRVEPDLLEAREHHAAATVDGRVYAVAGRTAGLDTNLASVESWSPGGTWTPAPPLTHARSGIGATVVGERLCTTGGEGPGGTIASLECLGRDVAGTWSVVGELAQPRHGLAVVARAGRIHVIGGGLAPGLFVSGIHEVLDP